MTLTDDELKHLRGMGGACEDYVDNRVGFPATERRIADACISALMALAERIMEMHAVNLDAKIEQRLREPVTEADLAEGLATLNLILERLDEEMSRDADR